IDKQRDRYKSSQTWFVQKAEALYQIARSGEGIIHHVEILNSKVHILGSDYNLNVLVDAQGWPGINQYLPGEVWFR
ncbi:MAG: hypothetical protein B6D74_00390, partial [gamma proteobacterium symbiont of Ctena orbiculata]